MIIRKFFFFLCIGVVNLLNASTTYWTGAEDSEWGNANNWNPSQPGSTDWVVFDGTITNQPSLGSNRTIRNLEVRSAGWEVDGDNGSGGLYALSFNVEADDNIKDLVVTNGGNIVFNCDIRATQQYRKAQYFADEGCELIFNGNVYGPASREQQWYGEGTFVFNGNFSGRVYKYNGKNGSYIFNCTNQHPTFGGQGNDDSAISTNHFVGGIAPGIRIYQYEQLKFESGSKLSPGGDPKYGGELISTMSFSSSSSTRRAWVTMQSGAEIEMDIGTEAGDSDQIVLGSLSNGFILNGCTLALRSTGSFICDGDYLIMVSTNYSHTVFEGTFGMVTYNDEPLDEANYDLTYLPSSSGATNIVLTLEGLKPSSGTVLIIQ